MKKRNIQNMLKSKKKAKVMAISVVMAGVLGVGTIVGVVVNKNDMINKKIKSNIVEAGENSEKEPSENEIVKGKNHAYKAEKNAVSPAEVRKMLDGEYEGELKDKKIVFLTFDDGPSVQTEKVLNILEEKGVQGTFFILGENIKKAEGNKDIIKKIIENGNSLGNHTYTHNFKKLYPGGNIDLDAFMKEYKDTENELKEILGDNFKNNLVRFPGGENTRIYKKDKNLDDALKTFDQEGISSIDWNALNGDAEGRSYSEEEMLNYVKKSSANKNHVVILMHDSAPKEKTIQTLPEVIEYYKSQGYEFKIIG
ncbi:polysaccharide deacetylase family protein [Clostridium massiliamazoniense]|uniref:polysaccharide deacetylase family protein n=1 Tax=Clostridium massiliamazoniense TaxID=1347366 RepID=UPI0006D7B56C|nr:polysaccharide deacetylase family protein [Clostridium massiliamazoniense]